MAVHFGLTLANNRCSQLQTTIGASGATLVIYSGALPANCAASSPTGVLATIALPASFLTSAGGTTTIAGTWSTTASATGTAACFRIFDGSAVCHIQGLTTTPDLVLNNTSITSGQTVSVTQFSVADALYP